MKKDKSFYETSGVEVLEVDSEQVFAASDYDVETADYEEGEWW